MERTPPSLRWIRAPKAEDLIMMNLQMAPYLAPIPANENERAEALRALHLIENPPEKVFDEIALLAAQICEVPLAAISLVDRDRQHFKAQVGFQMREAPREISFCSHVIAHGDAFAIPDLQADPQFRQHPLAQEPYDVRFYQGFPIRSHEGFIIGALCVMDHQPRELNPAQTIAMQMMARQLSTEIQLREALARENNESRRLYESRARYRDLVENLGDIVFQTTPEGYFSFLNAAWERITGYPTDSSVGRRVRDLLGSDIEVGRRTIFVRTAAGDLISLSVHARPQRDANGNFIGLAGTISDVTPQERAARTLRERNDVIDAFLKASPYMMGVVEMEGGVIRHLAASPRTQEFLGRTDMNVDTEQLIAEGLPREIVTLWCQKNEEAKNTHEPVSFQYVHDVVNKQGLIERRHLVATVSSIGDGPNGVPRFSYVVLDITEEEVTRRLLEDQRAKLTAASKMSALGEMASGIAHEINNPLSILRGHVQLIQRDAKKNQLESDDILVRVEKMDATIVRIAKIISSLRAFARDGERDAFEMVSVQKLVQDSLELCSTRFKNNNVDLQVVMPEQDSRLICRPVQISQVLLNLLNNAFDAVANQTEGRRWVMLQISESEEAVHFSVTDGGAGIPPQVQEKLMQPFFTTKEIGKGTGLGLSLSKGFIEDHGGQLALETRSANTQFKFFVPKKPVAKSRG